jgi:hypothetical protein
MAQQYFLVLRVLLDKEHRLRSESGKPIVGYYRGFGVTVENHDQMESLVKAHVTDGEVDWQRSTIEETSLGQLDAEIQADAGDIRELGVWYTSGRLLFPEG